MNAIKNYSVAGMGSMRRSCMTAVRLVCLAGLLWSGAQAIGAETRYVAHGGQTPATNYTSWATAASNIQDAIDVAVAGDTVLVSNGTYEVGGRTAGGGALTSRVVIAKAITVQSANNNPAVTIIKGAKDPATTNGPAAIRCVWMNAGSLIGFTVTNGATFANGAGVTSWADVRGGGVYCDQTATPVISNCVIVGNSAGNPIGGGSWEAGGGVFYGTVKNCTIAGNWTTGGGGGTAGGHVASNYCPVSYCVITGNVAYMGGGSFGNNLTNCLVAGNFADYGGAGYGVGDVIGCTVAGNASTNSAGSGGLYVFINASNSIVIFNTGGTYPNFINGGAVYGIFTYSCTTPNPASTSQSGGGNVVADPLFANQTAGNYRLLGNSPCVDAGTNESTGSVDLDGNARIQNGRVDMGAYEYGGMIYYVATNGTGNGDSWASATNSIQGAIDRTANVLDVVLVSNGVYDVGGRVAGGGALTSRVVIANAITVRSANNNPATTIIKGAKDPATTNGPAAIRCVWMNAGVLSGFTLTNGATFVTYGAGNIADVRGGGVYCDRTAAPVISNCVITGNSAGDSGNTGSGGGAFCGTVNNCTIAGNSAPYGQGAGGGTSGYTLNNTNYYFPVNNCIIISNAAYSGGGTYENNLTNCLVAGNAGTYGGGGYALGAVDNCTIVGNSASGYAGGLYVSGINVRNSVVYFNISGTWPNYITMAGYGAFAYCCTTPDPAASSQSGGGNVISDPLFVNQAGGNYRLNRQSPCVNTGTNQDWMATAVDLDGRPRLRYGRVDMGAYELVYKGAVLGFR